MTQETFSFNMIFEDARLGTFKYWPFKDNVKCNKAKMAEAGFYSSGKKSEPDLAICYICSKELDGWEENDDPWSEHKKHAPYCPLIKLGKKPSVLTVNNVIQLQKEHEELKLTRLFEEKKKQIANKTAFVTKLMEKAESKENDKPKVPARRKRSSRK